MLNQVRIEGTMCGKERPELKTFPSGDCYLRFSIQWEGETAGRKGKSFFNVVLHKKLAEQFNQENLWKKGDKVCAEGSLNIWKSNKGGYYTDIICQKLHMGGFPRTSPAPAPAKAAVQAPAKSKVAEHAAVDEPLDC